MTLNMRRNCKKIISDNRGSALLAVFMVITVIIILGMGIMALSLSNMQQAKSTDTFEKDYYVADGGAKQAVESLKGAVLEQYRLIAIDVKNNGAATSTNTATDFFSKINTAIASFVFTQPDASTGGPNNVSVQVSNDGGSPTRTYTILSTATDGKTIRKIKTNLVVTFSPVTQSSAYTPVGSETVICGGTFDGSSASVAITGTAMFGALKTKQWNFNYNGNSNPDAATLASLQSAGTAARFTWSMKYPGFSVDAKSNVTLSLPALADGTTVTNSSFKNYSVPSPIYLEGVQGASFALDSSIGTMNGGQIYSTGSFTDRAEIDGTAGNYVKIYTSGTFTQSNGQLNYVKVFSTGSVTCNNGPSISNSTIYSHGNISFSGRDLSNLTVICDGNLTISGGSSTNVTIYCKGSITDGSNTRTNMKVYCDSYTMSGGNIQGNSIIYAETYMHLESTVRGMFYSNGNIDCGNGSGVTGQLAAKGNITTTGYSFNQDSALLAQLNADPFVTSSPASGSVSVTQPADSLIFTNTPVYSEQ